MMIHGNDPHCFPNFCNEMHIYMAFLLIIDLIVSITGDFMLELFNSNAKLYFMEFRREWKVTKYSYK